MTYEMITKIGSGEVNEDSVLCVERDGNFCFVVADGLGSYGKGEMASSKLVEVFGREFCLPKEKNKAFLGRAFDAAQNEVLILQRTQPEKMRTTAAALSIIGGKFVCGHIGDSRIYHFHKKKFRSRTLDHSVTQMLVKAKQITEADMATHPDRNSLLRAIGDKWNEPRYELSKEQKLSKHDAFLLCTDGFWQNITSDVMTLLLTQSSSAGEWLMNMLDVVEKNGRGSSMDDYSAIAVIAGEV